MNQISRPKIQGFDSESIWKSRKGYDARCYEIKGHDPNLGELRDYPGGVKLWSEL